MLLENQLIKEQPPLSIWCSAWAAAAQARQHADQAMYLRVRDRCCCVSRSTAADVRRVLDRPGEAPVDRVRREGTASLNRSNQPTTLDAFDRARRPWPMGQVLMCYDGSKEDLGLKFFSIGQSGRSAASPEKEIGSQRDVPSRFYVVFLPLGAPMMCGSHMLLDGPECRSLCFVSPHDATRCLTMISLISRHAGSVSWR